MWTVQDQYFCLFRYLWARTFEILYFWNVEVFSYQAQFIEYEELIRLLHLALELT